MLYSLHNVNYIYVIHLSFTLHVILSKKIVHTLHHQLKTVQAVTDFIHYTMRIIHYTPLNTYTHKSGAAPHPSLHQKQKTTTFELTPYLRQ